MSATKFAEARLGWRMSASRSNNTHAVAIALVALAIAGFGLANAGAAPTDGQENSGQVEGVVAQTTVVRSKEPTPAEPAISVSGVVVDKETGSPIAGADVILRAKIENQQYAPGLPHRRDILARTKTDRSGRYAFDKVGIPPRAVDVLEKLRAGTGGAQVLAYADGKALNWVEVQSLADPANKIRLEKEAEVSGVIVDEDNQPVANAALFLRALYAGDANLDSLARDEGDLNLYSELRFQATADGQGAFRFPNMPRDYRAMIWCTGTTGQRGFFVIDTGENSFDTIAFRSGRDEARDVHRTPMRLQTEQKAWVEIKVVDHDGNPVDGGGVQAAEESGRYGGQASIGDDGTCFLIVNHSGPHTVYYSADPLSPMVGANIEVDIRTEVQPAVEIELPKSRIMTGSVLDADTGQPVVGAYVAGGALAVTGSDGRFHVPMKPGDRTLRIRHNIDGYYVPSVHTRLDTGTESGVTRVSVPEDGSLEGVVIKVARGLQVLGGVVGPNGNAVTGVVVRASNQDRPFLSASAITDEHGKFKLSGLSPHVDTRVSVASEVGAAETTIAAEPDQPWDETRSETVALKIERGVTLTGRVVHKGQPMPHIVVKLHTAPPRESRQGGTRYDLFGETKTDADGRYSMSGLKKGEQYRFEVIAPGDLQVRDWRHQSPYIQVIDADEGETVKLPDATLVSNGQRLSGQVVDTDGDPLPGVRISARLQSGGMLSRPQKGPPPWDKTDQNGRFSITNLPEERISLMAYLPNPAGGSIDYPANVQPELNASDIRIVLDPRLGSGIEDLDAE